MCTYLIEGVFDLNLRYIDEIIEGRGYFATDYCKTIIVCGVGRIALIIVPYVKKTKPNVVAM